MKFKMLPLLESFMLLIKKLINGKAEKVQKKVYLMNYLKKKMAILKMPKSWLVNLNLLIG